ncbi:Na+/H+ antiporter NhaA [Nonomuraea sp. NPDC051941]|uniref:Na+/H+ antiporter NhaA n=1 Tax=Nonomuraea sp. NPDC051941 TaxID=3364373 RepID=UPI0037CA2C0C
MAGEFNRSTWPEARRIADILRKETIGGALLLAAALTALIWANSPWAQTYQDLRAIEAGPAALHLNLDLATWAADGLLAIFFFVAGLELKREFVAGDLRDLRRATLDEGLAWIDMAGLAVLAGIGFTVSLLIGELAFGTGEADARFKIAVLAGSLTAALLATVILRLRARVYRRIHRSETADSDHDGIPDLYQQP